MSCVGEKIRKKREIKSLSQCQLASKAGLSQSFLSDVENGRKSPTVRSIMKLAMALDISPALLVDCDNKAKIGANGIMRGTKELIYKETDWIYKTIMQNFLQSLDVKFVEDIMLIRVRSCGNTSIDMVFWGIINLIFNLNRAEITEQLEAITNKKIEKVHYNEETSANDQVIIIILFHEPIID
ncbi:MAG: helix-turn-helix transcriptional regulator [Halanaerobium sp.]|nr:helix-turn-helix transcriptional regulator [Halanaerobium sp.]